MSVNYSNPPSHPVDVPVTDLDDEDDILFHEQTRTGIPIHNDNEDFLNGMDFENHNMNADSGPNVIGKIKSFFSRRIPKLSNSYEMVNTRNYQDSFDVDDSLTDADERDRNEDLRDFKIDMLQKKLKYTVGGGVIVIFVLVTLLLAFSGSKRLTQSYYSADNKAILSNSTHDFHPTTILISLDGFHPHYISPFITPTLHKMLMNDYAAPYMTPSFPSSTFPNHWTLVTGLYPSEHGIVGNTFYDPKLKKQFINTNPQAGVDPDFWQGGKPLWKVATDNGLNAAVHMWPGSEVPGVGPTVNFDRYNGSELLSSKVDRVLQWLDRGKIETRPELILTYVPTIDLIGHKYGIAGPKLVESLQYVDNFVELLFRELEQRNLRHIVNVVIVSDHGMAPTSNERLLYLDDIIDLNKIEHVDGWPLFGLRPNDRYSEDEIYEELQQNLQLLDKSVSDNFQIFKVEDLPKEWNFGGAIDEHRFNYRLAPLWVIPNVGYSITTKKQMEENDGDYKPKGVHGYNNTEVLMRAIFLASGPFFEQRLGEVKKVYPFANTEVYNLICESLNMKPNSNNGTEAYNVKSILSGTNKLPDDWNDPLGYPDLPYEVEHIVKDATYDFLWRKGKPGVPSQTTIRISTNTSPLKSMILEESSILNYSTQELPKPSDFEVDYDEDQHYGEDADGSDDADEGGKLEDSKETDETDQGNEDENEDENQEKHKGTGIIGLLNSAEEFVGNIFGSLFGSSKEGDSEGK